MTGWGSHCERLKGARQSPLWFFMSLRKASKGILLPVRNSRLPQSQETKHSFAMAIFGCHCEAMSLYFMAVAIAVMVLEDKSVLLNTSLKTVKAIASSA